MSLPPAFAPPRHRFAPLGLLLATLILPAQLLVAQVQETKVEVISTVVERDSDHRVVEWLTPTTDESGQTVISTNRYTEVATGMHWQDAQGEWQETVAEFVPAPGGFVAARGPHQVALASDLSVPEAVTLVTADGQTLRSTPTLLAYEDRATGQSVRLADLKPSRGELIAPGTVRWADAFDTVAADVQAVYRASSFECDVILRRQLPDPALFGLNPETTDLAVYTEFFETQPTKIGSHEVPVGEEETATDARLEFGSMILGRGRAFVLEPPGGVETPEVSVRKVWEQREGRDFLIERTAYRDLQPLLRELPEAAAPSPAQRAAQERQRRTAKLELPVRAGGLRAWPRTATGRLLATLRLPRQGAEREKEGDGSGALPSPRASAVAGGHPPVPESSGSIPHAARGVVLDWMAVGTSTNKTFDSLSTFYVSGPVNLSATMTFQPGTVIKYAKTNAPALNVLSGSTLVWQGAPYRPVCLTASDDNSVGEPLPGSTGTPTNTYASVALNLDGTGLSAPTTLTNLCIRHAAIGLQATHFGTSNPLIVRHVQVVNCNAAFLFQHGSLSIDSYLVQNALVYNSQSGSTVFRDLYDAKASGEFLTVEGASTLFLSSYNPPYSTAGLTNSVLVNVGSTNNVTLVNSGSPPSPTFVTAGAGAHYLNLSEPAVLAWFEAHPTNSSPPSSILANELPKTTVRAPRILPASMATDVTLSGFFDAAATGNRIGYHYWPIDFLASGVVLGTGTLLLTNGVVVAGQGTNAFFLGSGGKLVSRGKPEALNRLCWSSAVQELPLGGAPAGITRRNLFEVGIGTSPWPEIGCRFTQVDVSADSLYRRGFFIADQTNQNVAFAELRDSQFAGAYVNFSPVTYGGQALSVRNCLFRDAQLGAYRSYSGQPTLTVRNNLFQDGALTLYYYSYVTGDPQWVCTDNLFDGANLSAYSTATNRLYAGWNGYSASSAFFGGSGNKTSLVAAYQDGPLGRYYYPTNAGGTALAALRNAGSQSASLAQLFHHTTYFDQTKDGVDNPSKVDIGFHYAAVTAGTPMDSDQDGLPDFEEDGDGDGIAENGETDWFNADTDGDGHFDGEEVAARTDPLKKESWFPKRLAAWWWDGTNGTYRLGDRGQSPTQQGSESQVTNGFSLSGVHFVTSTNGPLRYAFKDATGRPNIRLDQGSIRLWFKPDWAWSNHPTSAAILDVGTYDTPNNFPLGFWSWNMSWDTNGSGWLYLFEKAQELFHARISPVTWSQPAWHELATGYNHDASWFFLDGVQGSYTNATTNIVSQGYAITDALLPPPAGLAQGFGVGATYPGTLSLNGIVDSLETFNYPLGNVESQRHQQLTTRIVTNAGVRQLQFTRTYQGAPSRPGFPTLDPVALTLWRRPLGSGSWGNPLLANSTTETWTDTTLTVGTPYEYKASIPLSTPVWYRHFVAGIEMPPQHQRGNVILLVDTSLVSSLTNELAQLQTNLVGDGWTVKQFSAPRHNDTDWSVNTNNRANVVNLIASNYVVGTTNVIFLVGHVTIPYSGISADDGHGPDKPPDHRGAWVCDAHYGFTNKAPWTDTNSAPGNSAGDGKFDLNELPSVPDFAVGRIDFARLPAFAPLTELDLIKRYLTKDSRYRANTIPTFGRVSCHGANGWNLNGVSAAQSFAGAAFDVTPGVLFNGSNLRDQVPADLGVHFHYGSTPDVGVNDYVWANFPSSTFANVTKEVPVTFRLVWFSWACDWARLSPLNQVQIENNWLLASLGWPNHGLATFAGYAWDFAPLGGGAPLADLMQRGWEGSAGIPRFQSILGDPTLRLHRVTPVSNLKGTTNGSSVTLSWSPSPDTGCRYYVYRSTNGLSDFSVPLNATNPSDSLTFTDSSAPGGPLLYQVRATKLQVTGSGSYWNLSPGTFTPLP